MNDTAPYPVRQPSQKHGDAESRKLCKQYKPSHPTDLIQQYVRRLDVEIETAPGQMDAALQALAPASSLTFGLPRHTNGNLTLTVTGREAIPELLNLLVQNHIRIYRMSPHQPTLEDVYFALHDEKETVQ